MKRKRRHNAASYGFSLFMLGLESQQVMALRLAKLAKGDTHARHESARMLSEKMLAGVTATLQLCMGASPAQVVTGYRTKVRANRKRLSK